MVLWHPGLSEKEPRQEHDRPPAGHLTQREQLLLQLSRMPFESRRAHLHNSMGPVEKCLRDPDVDKKSVRDVVLVDF